MAKSDAKWSNFRGFSANLSHKFQKVVKFTTKKAILLWSKTKFLQRPLYYDYKIMKIWSLRIQKMVSLPSQTFAEMREMKFWKMCLPKISCFWAGRPARSLATQQLLVNNQQIKTLESWKSWKRLTFPRCNNHMD